MLLIVRFFCLVVYVSSTVKPSFSAKMLGKKRGTVNKMIIYINLHIIKILEKKKIEPRFIKVRGQ